MSAASGEYWRRASLAGGAYFAVVFVLGFMLGVLRVRWLEPAVGEAGAVAAELPLMLGASWWICRRVVELLAVPASTSMRLAMGVSAFVLLIVAEAGIAAWILDRGLSEHLASYRQPSALLGLAGQIAFAALPLIQGRLGSRRPRA